MTADGTPVTRERDRGAGPVLGAARWRRQLRRRDVLHVRPAPARARGPGRADAVARRGRAASVAVAYRDFMRGRAGRTRRCAGDAHRAAGAVRARRTCRARRWRASRCCGRGRSPTAIEAIAPLRRSAARRSTSVGPMPYADFQCMIDDPPGFRQYWSGDYLDGLPDDAVDVFVKYGSERPSPLSAAAPRPVGRGGRRGSRTRRRRWPTGPRRWITHPFALVGARGARPTANIAWVRAFRRGHRPLHQRRRVPELHRHGGAGPHPGGLRGREVPTARPDQGGASTRRTSSAATRTSNRRPPESPRRPRRGRCSRAQSCSAHRWRAEHDCPRSTVRGATGRARPPGRSRSGRTPGRPRPAARTSASRAAMASWRSGSSSRIRAAFHSCRDGERVDQRASCAAAAP